MDAVAAGLLLVRVIVGVTLAAHGYNKFFGGGRIPGTARWFESIGMRPGRLHALFAATTEIGAGLLFAAGLLTPLAAAGFAGLMLVAAWTVHRENGFFSAGDGWEYNLILAVVAVGVATAGPGDWSVDHAIGLRLDGGWGLLISAAGGLAAGATLLATCYRPTPRTNPPEPPPDPTKATPGPAESAQGPTEATPGPAEAAPGSAGADAPATT